MLQYPSDAPSDPITAERQQYISTLVLYNFKRVQKPNLRLNKFNLYQRIIFILFLIYSIVYSKAVNCERKLINLLPRPRCLSDNLVRIGK